MSKPVKTFGDIIPAKKVHKKDVSFSVSKPTIKSTVQSSPHFKKTKSTTTPLLTAEHKNTPSVSLKKRNDTFYQNQLKLQSLEHELSQSFPQAPKTYTQDSPSNKQTRTSIKTPLRSNNTIKSFTGIKKIVSPPASKQKNVSALYKTPKILKKQSQDIQSLFQSRSIPPNAHKKQIPQKDIQNTFNNQALLFEKTSTFGKLARNIRAHNDLGSRHILNPITKAKITYLEPDQAHKDTQLKSPKKSSFVHTFLLKLYTSPAFFIFSVCIIISGIFVISNTTFTNISSARSIEKTTFGSIEIDTNSFTSWAQTYGFSYENIDDQVNNSELPLWAHYYLSVDPTTSGKTCDDKTYFLLIRSFIDINTCESIINIEPRLYTNSQSKQVELAKEFMFANIDEDKKTEYSLTYIFGKDTLQDIINDFDELIENDIALDTLFTINVLDTVITQEVINANIATTTLPQSGVRFLEAAQNYQVDVATLVTFSHIDSLHGIQTNSDAIVYTKPQLSNQSIQKNINSFASFVSQLDPNTTPCQIGKIYQINTSCNQINELHSMYSSALSK